MVDGVFVMLELVRTTTCELEVLRCFDNKAPSNCSLRH